MTKTGIQGGEVTKRNRPPRECDICGETKRGVRLYDCYDGTISLGYMLICPDCVEVQREVGETIPQD